MVKRRALAVCRGSLSRRLCLLALQLQVSQTVLHGLYWVLLGLASSQQRPSTTMSVCGFWSTQAHASESWYAQAISTLTSPSEPTVSVSIRCASALSGLQANGHHFPHSTLCADAKKQHPWLSQADEYEWQQSPEVKRQLEHWVDGIAAEVAAEEEHALRWVAALEQPAVLAFRGSCCSCAMLVVPDMRGSAFAVRLDMKRGQQGLLEYPDL